MKLALAVALFAIASLPSASQTKPVPVSLADATRLQVRSNLQADFHGGLLFRPRCDHDGNIYARLAPLNQPNSPDHRREPVRRFQADGRLVGTLAFPAHRTDVRASHFFVTSNGKVYFAGRSDKEREVYVLVSAGGTDKETLVKLKTHYFLPYQVAAFDSGEILVSGIHDRLNHTPITAVFDATGNPLKTIYEPEDESARRKADARDSEYVLPAGSSNSFVTHGDIAIGSDGNAYLLRYTSPALIYVISHRGEVLRKLHIESPSAGMRAHALTAADGQLAVTFLPPASGNGVIEIIDLNGTHLGTLAADEDDTPAWSLGCYDSSIFTFFNDKYENFEHNLYIARTTAK